MSRDPDGVNLPEDYSPQLEPSGSHYDDERDASTVIAPRGSADIVMDEFRDEGEGKIVLDMKQIIGLPPPPPTSKPPKRRKKKGNESINQVNISLSLSDTLGPKQTSMSKKTSEAGVCDDCDVNSINTSTKIVAKFSSSSPRARDIVHKQLELENTNRENDLIVSDELQGGEELFHPQSQLNCSATPSDITTIPGDTRASPTMRNQEEIVTEAPSHTNVTEPHINLSHDMTSEETGEIISSSPKSKANDQKRTKKRGFFKKLFGGGKNHGDHQSIDHVSPKAFAPAPKSKSMASVSTVRGDNSLPNPAMVNSSDHHSPVQPVDKVLPVLSRSRTEDIDEVSNNLFLKIEDIPDDKSIEIEQSTSTISQGSMNKFQEFSLDPPDNDNGDPPENSGRPLLSPTAYRKIKLSSETSISDEDEHMRTETLRSRIAEVYSDHEEHPVMNLESKSLSISEDVDFASGASDDKSGSYDQHDPKFSDAKICLQVETDKILCKDPVGASPSVQGNTGGNHINRSVSGDPQGETPKARENARTPSNDPVGVSYCHASKTMDSSLEVETASLDVYNSNLNLIADNRISESCEDESSFDGKAGSSKSNSQYPESSATVDFAIPEFVSPRKDRSVPQTSTNKVANPSSISLSIDTGSATLGQSSLSAQVLKNDGNEVKYSKKIQIDIEKSGFKSASSTPTAGKDSLTVSAAAFTNAKAIAYLHRLQGEPSPRLTWHSKNSIAPPLSEKSIALAKIRAFNSKRKKGKVENMTKIKGPSPYEYSATNSKVEAMIKEKYYVNHDPSKQFAPYSRFKGRRPRTKNAPKLEYPSHEMLAMPLQDVIQHTVDLALVIPSGKITGLAVARGAELRQIKREVDIHQSGRSASVILTTSQKPTGRNRFNFFPAKESEIKDPVQRAGRRLLSKAAIPIQAGVRMFLSRRKAMDRMWSLIRIQSYFRRWRCEANLHEHQHSATLAQKIYRGYRGREDLKNRNICATSMQKIVRGYLSALHAYETIYFISRAQALARGFLVRTSLARRAEALRKKQNAATLIQNCYHDHISRQNAALMKRACATTIQSVWRSSSARTAFKMNVVDIIIVQSIARRRSAIITADLIRKSIHSIAITRYQAVWRGYAERNRLQKHIAAKKIQHLWSRHVANGEYQKIRAATKIQASWRGFQAYTDFIFVIVDILVVQRSARQWLAVRKTNKLRQERAAIVLQSAWRGKRAQLNLLHSLVHIIVVQSIARRFLADNEVEVRRKERQQNDSFQRKKDCAATTIQTSWRGFWDSSHFIIVQYEITRIQALMRGKLARDRFNLNLGCAILIQAVTRRFLARKAASTKVIDRTVVVARSLELRERNSAKHIQFWWRIVLDWMKEKRAALVIERFFIFVKTEVDRELRVMEQNILKGEKSRKKHQKGSRGNFLDNDRMNTVDAFSPQVVKKNLRSESAPRSRPSQKKNLCGESAPRSRPSQNHLPVTDTNNCKSFQNRNDRGFLETSDMQSPPDILHLAPSADISMVSNITTPSLFDQFSKGVQNSRTGQTNSEGIYQEVRTRSKNEKHRRLSTEDYIKKYGGLKTAPNKSLSKSQSQNFFSDDINSGDRKPKRQSYGETSTIYMQGQMKVTTSRKGHHEKPVPLSTGHNKDFEIIERTPATPRSSSGGNRSGSTPRNATRSRRDVSSSQFLPPVTPTRKKSVAILHSATAITECSTPVENEKMYIPPRPRSSPRKHSSIHGRGHNAVMIMKTNPDFMDDKTIEEAHEIMLLGDDYGEV